MLLKLDNVTKGYTNPVSGRFQQVLNNVSFYADKGDSVAVVGPSGSGKTTLLNIIGTLDRPDSGSVYFMDRDITDFTTKETEIFRNKEVGFIFQLHHLLPQCTLYENVLLPALPQKNSSNAHERAEQLIKRVGLWEHKDKKPQLQSGGECQRTAVVRALINNPGLILADEPTGALDHENALKLTELLLEINREENLTLIIVTHSEEIAEKMKRILILKDGRLEPI